MKLKRGGDVVMPLDLARCRESKRHETVTQLIEFVRTFISAIDADSDQAARELCITIRVAVESLNRLLHAGKLGDAPQELSSWPVNYEVRAGDVFPTDRDQMIPWLRRRKVSSDALFDLDTAVGKKTRASGGYWLAWAREAVECARAAALDAPDLRSCEKLSLAHKQHSYDWPGERMVFDDVHVLSGGLRLVLPCWFETCERLPRRLNDDIDGYCEATRQLVDYHMALHPADAAQMMQRAAGPMVSNADKRKKIRERIVEKVKELAGAHRSR